MSSLFRKFIPARQSILVYSLWWTTWIVIQTLVLHHMQVCWPEAFADAAITMLVLAVAGFVTANTYRFYTPSARNIMILGAYILLLAIISTEAQLWLFEKICQSFEWNRPSAFSIPLRGMFSLLMIAFMAVLHWSRSAAREQQNMEKRKEEVEKLLRETELSKLRQQLQPHFLFNSLNSISALAGSRPEEARKMVQQLSDFLRGTLRKDEQQLVPLLEELHHLQLYLEIEKVRFGHRLQTNITSDEKCSAMKLPPLMLQPIVENAVKFGLYDTIGEILISIIASCESGFLVLKIENPYDSSTSKPKSGTGFGLSFIQRRLYLIYARQDLLETKPGEKTFVTTVKIPQLND